MNLFYIVPINRNSLRPWLITEALLIIMNGISIIFTVKFIKMLRIHINLKIMGITAITVCFLGIISRFVIIGSQADVFPWITRNNCTNVPNCLLPEENRLIVISSWIRGWFLALSVTAMMWFSVERMYALYYLHDYEQYQRVWIALVIILLSFLCSAVFTSIYNFKLLSLNVLAALSLLFILLGFYLYLVGYWRTKHILHKLTKDRHWTLKYNLSLRYQIDENLWCYKLLRNTYITVCIFDVYTLIAYSLATLEQSKLYLGEEITQHLDCLYNTLICLNGPIMAIGSVAFNPYTIAVFKRMFCCDSQEERKLNDTELYFDHLRKQWEISPEDEMKRHLDSVKKWREPLTLLSVFKRRERERRVQNEAEQ